MESERRTTRITATLWHVRVEELLRRRGGVASRAQLLAGCPRSEVDAALGQGRVVAVAHGRYALPHVEADARTAHGLRGVLSYESAALHHGWPVLLVPDEPHVTVPVKRKVDQERRRTVVLHRADLHPDEVSGEATSQARTLVDCMRNLPLRQALAVADSALRAGRSPSWLSALAADLRGRGAARARRVAAEATDLAANPFESALRAIALEVDGMNVRPQVSLYADDCFLGRPDLVDTDLGIVAEADSFEWHGSRAGLVRDARRYNDLVVNGWLVLRFTWEDVVLEPERVAAVLAAAVEARRKVASGPLRGPGSRLSSVQLRE